MELEYKCTKVVQPLGGGYILGVLCCAVQRKVCTLTVLENQRFIIFCVRHFIDKKSSFYLRLGIENGKCSYVVEVSLALSVKSY